MSAELLARLSALSGEERVQAFTALAQLQWVKVDETANRRIREDRKEDDEQKVLMESARMRKRQADPAWRDVPSRLVESVVRSLLCR